MDSPTPHSPEPIAAPIANIEVKAVLLLLLMLALIVGTVAYVLYARGAFERTQELVLLADDSEGVVLGMDMTFSGFPIGRVRRVELADKGNVRIIIDVPSKDARWLRTSKASLSLPICTSDLRGVAVTSKPGAAPAPSACRDSAGVRGVGGDGDGGDGGVNEGCGGASTRAI